MSTAAAKTKPAARKRVSAKTKAAKPKKTGGGKAISNRKTKAAPAEPQPEQPQPRRGRQTPTASVVLPYTDTKGQEAAELYAATGRTAQEWQLLLFSGHQNGHPSPVQRAGTGQAGAVPLGLDG